MNLAKIIIWCTLLFSLNLNIQGRSVRLDTIPFDCNPAFFQTIGDPATLVQYDATSVNSGFINLIRFPFQVNSTGYNPVDNFIYTIARPGNDLIRIHGDGTWVNLGNLPGVGQNYVGDFTDDGLYYVKGGNATVYIIDVNTLGVTTFTTNPIFDAADWAFRKSDRTFYGARFGNIYGLHQPTHTVTVTPIAGLPNDGGAFGAAFVTDDGTIYVARNNTGNVYEIDLVNQTATVIATGPSGAGTNDGASCPDAPNPLTTHVFSENDTICQDTFGGAMIQVLLNDEGYLNDLDLATFRILQSPGFGRASFNTADSTITYAASNDPMTDSLVYTICGDNIDYPACDTATVYFFASNVVDTMAQICDGEQYFFGDTNYENVGVYQYTFTNQNGCDSIVTLNLMVNTPVPVTIDTTICLGEKFTFLGSEYDQTTTVSQMVADVNGCDALHTLNLIVGNPITINLKEEICDGEEYMVGDSIFVKTGLYSVLFERNMDCDSTVNLDLTVLENSDFEIKETICAGDTVFVGNSFYTTSGIFTDVLKNAVGCDSTITTELIVIDLPEITISNLEEICSLDKLTFYVRFEISGGDPTSYTVNGLAGNLIGNIFESDPLSSGSSYGFTIMDATGCHELIVNRPSFECLCETDAGTIDDELIEVCFGETASVFHQGNQFLDINDSLIFVLHDGSRNVLGNVLIRQRSVDFQFDLSIMDFNTSYFVAAVAGNIDPVLGVDFNDICLSVSNSAELIFRELPNGTLLGEQTICEGDSAIINFNFTGTPPFEITWSDGSQNFNFSTNDSSFEIVVNPSNTTNYNFVELKDAYCFSSINEQIGITVNLQPFAEIQSMMVVCNDGQTGQPTTLNFSDFVIAGDRNGSWKDLNNSGAIGVFPILDFAGVAAGIYQFEYETTSALPPCGNVSYTMEVEVIDCLCPSVELSNPPALCNNDATLILDDYKITPEDGAWQIINEPIGSTAEIVNNIFTANNSSSGNYELEFRLTQIPPTTCPSSNSITVSISEFLTAGVDPPLLEICNDSQPIDLNDQLIGASLGGVWSDISTSSAPRFDALTGILVTENLPTGNYVFQYIVTPQLPCPSDTVVLEIEIDNPVWAGELIENIEFCEGENATINLFDNIKNYDLGGEWLLRTGDPFAANELNGMTGDLRIHDLPIGEYTFIYLVKANGICPDVARSVDLKIGQPVNAGNPLQDIEFCEGTETTIFLFENIENYESGGEWTQVSGNNISPNDFDERTGELIINGLVSGSYEFQYKIKSTGICPGDSVQINLIIEEPVSAGDLLRDESFCKKSDTSIVLFDYIENYDLGGEWLQVSGENILTNDFDALSARLRISNLLSGEYKFQYTVQAEKICPDDQVVFTLQINPNPIANAGDDQGLDCLIREVVIGSNGSSGLNYFWESNFQLPNQSNHQIANEGLYILTVVDQTTGCSDIDSVQVLETANYPQLQPNSIDLTCFGVDDGVIRVENVVDGIPPFMYSLNGAPFTDDDVFENLEPGEYHLLLEDSEGCTDKFTFQIFEPNELTVALSTSLVSGSNIIEYGDSVLLRANISESVDSIAWSPDDAFEPCDPEADPDGCISQWVQPTELTTYEVFVVNENGCSDRSSVTIDVDFNPAVYIPSAFTPNNDGVNDIFEIYTNDRVERILTFQIYDRWGESVFQAYDFESGDPAFGWNGLFRNEKMNPAVFAYYVEVLFINGETKMFEGDVSLLR